MQIKIDIKRSKPQKKVEKHEDEINLIKEKSNPISKHIKKMSLTKKIVYGGLATFLATRAIDNLTEQKDIVIIPSQYENINSNNQAYETKPNNEQIKVIADPIKVDAKEVITDYTHATTYDEQKTIDALYKDKYLEVSGKVGEVVDQDTIRILNEDNSKWYSEWMSIECDFNNQVDLEKIQELQAGSEVNVVGYCNGYDKMTVEMDDCILTEIKK